jgi:hypothetical protein
LDERKKLRMMRFQGDSPAGTDMAQLQVQLEDEQQRKKERMDRFGTLNPLGDKSKIKERQSRFVQPDAQEATQDTEKVNERKARFGTLDVKEKQKMGSLEFSLDDVASR